jgi:hypothetical protein
MTATDTEFWNAVGDKVDPLDIAVGDAIKLETSGRPFVIMIVTEAWDDPTKGRQIRFRPATFDDQYVVDELITVVC